MTIGDVFARAWDLWRRDVLWLILAGLVVGLILAVILGITYGISLSLFAGAGAAIGGDALDNSSSGLTGLGIGIGLAGIVVYVVAMFLVQVVAMTFYGGLYEMVIGSYREQRDVRFGDLFSGFRKFGSYVVFALVMFGISLGLGLLNLLPFLGAIISFCVSIWLAVIWLYVLPLIADHGMTFMEAAGKSNQMVRGAGWWWTFFKVFLLGLAALAAVAVIVLVARAVGHADGSVGIVVGVLLFLVFAVLFPPYAICYVSVLYVGSGGEIVTVPAGGGMGMAPPAPPAPPAPGAATYGSASYGTTATTWGPPAGADAWRAASDPLAAAPPPPLPASGSADGAATPAPDAPEAPAPPAPPAT